MTELARNKLRHFTPHIVCVFILLGAGLYQRASHQDSLRLNGAVFAIETVKDESSRSRGLSGRESMADNHAMVFVFDYPTTQCFWMKDMKFSIDMVWVDVNNHVSSIESNVSPNSYPQNFCHEGLHVIEFVAGTANKLNLQNGDQVYLRAQH